MHSEFWLLILLHIALAAAALVKIWRRHDGKLGYRGIWTVFVLLVPGIGPLFTLAFFEMPSVKSDPALISKNDDGQML